MSARDLARSVRLQFRRAYLALRFAGRPIHVHPSSYVSRRSVIRTTGGGSIRIGAGCEIHDFAMILTYGGRIEIGDRSSVNPFTIVYGHGGTRIGTGVRIAAHSVIIPANHRIGTEERPVHESGVHAQGIEIGDHVWIGAGCRILDGVNIGRHTVVGAGSVVTQSLPENATAVGAPARVIATR
jgi:acetyltransferase-like isoleucine patch superfamily enzyme